jgi:hypothetical protein
MDIHRSVRKAVYALMMVVVVAMLFTSPANAISPEANCVEAALYSTATNFIKGGNQMTDEEVLYVNYGTHLNYVRLLCNVDKDEMNDNLNLVYSRVTANLTINGPDSYFYESDDIYPYRAYSYSADYYGCYIDINDIDLDFLEGNYTFRVYVHYKDNVAAWHYSTLDDLKFYVNSSHPGQDPVTYGEMMENTLGGIGALILLVGPVYLWYVNKHDGTILAMGTAMVVLMIGFTFFYVFLLGG